jgi:hypothetical protein
MRRTVRSRTAPPTAGDVIGIVIADGGNGDALPRFSAFVWGPGPDEDVALLVAEPALVAT